MQGKESDFDSSHHNFTVDCCEEDIPMLQSLSQTNDNSSDYIVICEGESAANNTMTSIHSCINNQWSTEIECSKIQKSISSTAQPTGNINYFGFN